MSFVFLIRRLLSLHWLSPEPCDGRKQLGGRGERAAVRHLRHRGLRLLTRNYRCPAGEIDLICRDGAALVFVEVKTRTDFGVQNPTEAVRRSQWQTIERAAKYFLTTCVRSTPPCRFDLVTVEWNSDGRVCVNHNENVHQPSFR